MADVDRCVVCGAPVPEGRMVCWACERKAKEKTCQNCFWYGRVVESSAGIWHKCEYLHSPHLIVSENNSCEYWRGKT